MLWFCGWSTVPWGEFGAQCDGLETLMVAVKLPPKCRPGYVLGQYYIFDKSKKKKNKIKKK